ncbi:pyridoxal phosphate-dependent transferase [Aspergillus novoparasiticus]|uniref:Ornithine aminotransferase n=1 Tax=Aspergillus novoparasiticus TaxID=986946 RepID=A0A5N6EKH4_9EURO|nr:pyridoxal phosphate-dependent transferase [Aspergillus novoparasiticus]
MQSPRGERAVKETLTTEHYLALNRQFCAPTHAPIPIVLSRGVGARVWDITGKEYIDFLSAFSVVNQGHCHPRIISALKEQCQKLTLCTSAFQNETYPQLCKRICELLEYDMAASMSSGSEAIDLAIKIARKWGYKVKGIPPDQAKVLTVTGNYHGKILGPLSASSNEDIKDGFGPFLPNVGPSVAGFPVRFNSVPDMEKVFEAQGDKIAAVIIECVQGYGGCVPAEPKYLQAVYELCQKYQILFIADEIQTGFGRTGSFMAYQHENIKPDLVVIGKALTGGVYPMSMVVGKESIMTQIKPGQHSSTFAANPLASVVALAAIDVTISEGLSERARHLGAKLMDRLRSIKVPSETSIRVTGRGFFYALHIDETHPSGRITAYRLSMLMLKRGVIAIPAQNRVRIAPPLTISEDDLWKGVKVLEDSLHELLDLDEI